MSISGKDENGEVRKDRKAGAIAGWGRAIIGGRREGKRRGSDGRLKGESRESNRILGIC